MANGGWETFLSYEDLEQDIFVGLRKLSDETFRPELVGGCSVVRELHVYGVYRIIRCSGYYIV